MKTLKMSLCAVLIILFSVNAYPQIKPSVSLSNKRTVSLLSDNNNRWLPFNIPKEFDKQTAYWKLNKKGFSVITEQKYFLYDEYNNVIRCFDVLGNDENVIFLHNRKYRYNQEYIYTGINIHNNPQTSPQEKNVFIDEKGVDKTPKPVVLPELSSDPDLGSITRTVVVYHFTKTDDENNDNNSYEYNGTNNSDNYSGRNTNSNNVISKTKDTVRKDNGNSNNSNKQEVRNSRNQNKSN